jgi:hypothetical protein
MALVSPCLRVPRMIPSSRHSMLAAFHGLGDEIKVAPLAGDKYLTKVRHYGKTLHRTGAQLQPGGDDPNRRAR